MTPRPTVADFMTTSLVTLAPDMEVNRAVAILLENGISGAPVVDARGGLVGMISSKDCLRAALHASYHHDLGGVVADYMTKEVETLSADLDIFQAAERFIERSYRRFPVLREGRLAGQISRADLLRALSEQWRQ
jgi:CBS domain-containing protein